MGFVLMFGVFLGGGCVGGVCVMVLIFLGVICLASLLVVFLGWFRFCLVLRLGLG